MRTLAQELIKAVLIVALVLLVQMVCDPEGSLRFGRGSNVAHAVGRCEDDLEDARRALLEAMSTTRDQMLLARDDLEHSAAQLSSNREYLSRLISDRQERFSVQLANYKGTLEDAIGMYEESLTRLQTVEKQVHRMAAADSEWMERSMLLPTIQLKGNKTVGSGVIIYSQLDSVGPTDEEAEGDAEPAGDPRYVTFAVTAYHVVKEILGEEFPLGILRDVRLMRAGSLDEPLYTSAVVERFSAERDLALLRLRLTSRFENVASFLSSEEADRLNLFTRVYAVGCPLGNSPLPTSGEISSRSKQVGDQVFWMVTAPTFFGNSGGGIFLADTCELIGISSMVYTYTYGLNRSMVVPHMGLFVPIRTVTQWLRSEGFEHILLQEPPRVAPPSREPEDPVPSLPLSPTLLIRSDEDLAAQPEGASTAEH